MLFAVGDTLEELTMRLEASEELIEIIKQQTQGGLERGTGAQR